MHYNFNRSCMGRTAPLISKETKKDKKPGHRPEGGRNGVLEETKKPATKAIKVGQSSTNRLTDTYMFSLKNSGLRLIIQTYNQLPSQFK